LAASVTWEKDGFLFGAMTRQELASGGRWAVGDSAEFFPKGHPGKSGFLKLKSWIASFNKYAPGKYGYKNRTLEGENEYVAVRKGSLSYLEKKIIPSQVDSQCSISKISATEVEVRREEITRVFLCSGLAAAIPPNAERSWELPHGDSTAAGVTALYRGEAELQLAGVRSLDETFFLNFWDFATKGIPPHKLFGFLPPGENYVGYVEVFSGGLQTYSSATPPIAVMEREYLYFRPGSLIRIDDYGSRFGPGAGVVVFYKQ